ncbi:orange carotenoid protein N-terminal domain-containing protein [Phormidesmis priestleyi]|uniref:orange carotenoid protein N-terminal domain-containing protein n=1 Tax=Phormidesmis priestleyi TaxID=268141 RepID=UPI001FD325CE|nr:orange carotenoid protein N-terminal domain-containing protein [Phormidesmis priestleyi]
MENETIIQVPSDYQPPSEASEFSDLITQLDFEQRVEFMRQAGLGMGSKSTKATSM